VKAPAASAGQWSGVDEVRLEQVVDGLSFPTSLMFDAHGAMHVAESGLAFGGAPPGGRVWRYLPDGSRKLVADELQPPVTGITPYEDGFIVSENGPTGRITRMDGAGVPTVVLDGLPGPGNYHTNMVVVGPDGRLYFSQGAMSNAAIIGLDSFDMAWLRRLPHAHDLPGHDIVLAGVNVTTDDPRERAGRTSTGAFMPFGQHAGIGTRVSAALPCTAAVMRCHPDGSHLELVAWGLRNAFGLGFLPDGRLLAIDQGPDDRGSRPFAHAPDLLVEVRHGGWYGWPDFIGGDPVTDARYRSARGVAPSFVLTNHEDLPPLQVPLVRFPANTAAAKFDVAPHDGWWFPGDLLVALFGDERPLTAVRAEPAGRGLARVDTVNWSLHPWATSSLHRPIDVRFSPLDRSPYILDFGRFEIGSDGGFSATAGTGAVWRLTPSMESSNRPSASISHEREART
jgi:glucose/arabinose dehydrogenase